MTDGQFSADYAFEFKRCSKLGEAHRSAEVIVVGYGQRTVAKLSGAYHKLFQR